MKAQRELAEVQVDTGLDTTRCEIALEKLIDLRLVRHVETYYEITHDFVARKVVDELADSDEKEFKRFRELLSSKAAAYSVTRSGLTAEELLMLYKHRQRIIPTDQELHLMLISFVHGTGPTLYWLLNKPPEKIAGLLSAEGVSQGFSEEQKANVVLLRRKLGENVFPDGYFSCFRDFKHSWELTRLIAQDPVSLPAAVLGFGLRHRREEVREAALHAVAERIKKGESDWVAQLARSSSLPSFRAYLRLVFRRDIPLPVASAATRTLLEFSLLQRLERTSSIREAQQQRRCIAEARLPNRVRVFCKALFLAKTRRLTTLLNLCDRLARDEAVLALQAVEADVSVSDMTLLLDKFASWTYRYGGRHSERSRNAKLIALAEAILRASTRKHLPQLRHFVKSATLSPATRPIVLALMAHGSSSDFENVLGRIATADETLKFWNHTQLGHCAAALMSRSSDGIPTFLKDATRPKEFWIYLGSEERRRASAEDLLPLNHVKNRALFIRLVGYGAIGAAKSQDADLLVRLSGHGYGMVARAAATRLADLLGKDVLNLLAKEIDTHIQQRKVESFANAIRFAEMRVFGLI